MSGIDIANLDYETLCNLLLHCSSNMDTIDDRIIIEATIEYIEKNKQVKLIVGAGVLPRCRDGVSLSCCLGGMLVSVDQHEINLA